MKFTNDRELCGAYAKKLSNGFYSVTLEGFAEACFNDNTIDELRFALLARSADKTDCAAWNITPTEWRSQIETALAAKIIESNNDMLPNA